MKDIEFLQTLNKPLQREEMALVYVELWCFFPVVSTPSILMFWLSSAALKKLQVLLNHPAQFKARLNEVVSLQRIQESAPPTQPNQLGAQDLEKIFQVTCVCVCGVHVWGASWTKS